MGHREIGEIGHHNDGIIGGAPPPEHDALPFFKIDMKEIDGIDRECRMRSAQLDKSSHIVEQCSAVRPIKPVEIHWIDLLATLVGDMAAPIKKIMLIAKLFSGQNHRDAERRQQADEAKLDAPQPCLVQDDLIRPLPHFVIRRVTALFRISARTPASISPRLNSGFTGRERDDALHLVVEPLFTPTFDIMTRQVIDHLLPIQAINLAVNGAADRPLEGRLV